MHWVFWLFCQCNLVYVCVCVGGGAHCEQIWELAVSRFPPVTKEHSTFSSTKHFPLWAQSFTSQYLIVFRGWGRREGHINVSQACFDKSALKHAQHGVRNYLCNVMNWENWGNLELFKNLKGQYTQKMIIINLLPSFQTCLMFPLITKDDVRQSSHCSFP